MHGMSLAAPIAKPTSNVAFYGGHFNAFSKE